MRRRRCPSDTTAAEWALIEPLLPVPAAGAVPVLAAFAVDPWYAVRVLVFVPAAAFGSVIAGTALLGVAGMVIAIPVVATMQTFFSAYVKRYDVADDLPAQNGRRYPRTDGPSLLARLRGLLRHRGRS